MKLLCLTLTLLFTVTHLSGCNATYKDISQNPEYSDYIGKQYVLNVDMVIQGIDLSNKGDIHLYSISKLYPVMHKSPEEITSNILGAGSKFTVLKIRKCDNCLPFDNRIDFVVSTADFIKQVDVPIKISMKYMVTNDYVAQSK